MIDAQQSFWRNFDAWRDQEEALWENFKRAFPEGTPVKWTRGGVRQFGNVVSHGYRGSFFVRNERTNREIKLHASDLSRA